MEAVKLEYMGASSMSNTSDKLSILDSFIEEVNSYLPEIEANLERLAEAPGDMDALEETYRRTHTIGGSASMMDFPGLSHVAHGMEDILGDVLDGLATLDPPTIGLLQRSLGRLHRLLAGIQSGIDQEAIIAEDDEDYTRYRMMIEAGEQAGQPDGAASEQLPTGVTPPAAPSMPSLDEVLASFRTPSISEGEEIEWPEDPAHEPTAPAMTSATSTSIARETAQPSMQPVQPIEPVQPAPPAQAAGPVQVSALDMLVATTRQTAPQPAVPATPHLSPDQQLPPASSTSPASSAPVSAPLPAGRPAPTAPKQSAELVPVQGKNTPVDGSFLRTYGEMQNEAQALEAQASSLRNLVGLLRSAVHVIEEQRAEFKGFLDGSKDALDRMEDWAGKAMGLNLRNSPEQVRRYLPLSVMWVANSKLKKVLELLNVGVSGAQMTDEQIQEIVQQLHNSLVSCGAAFQQLQAQANTTTPIFRQEPGWTPWEMQSAQEPNTVRERVTFERQGDIAALRAQIEAQLQGDIAILRTRLEQQIREELRQEYEARPLSLAARAELEQQIRNEVRQEYEARRQLQAQVSGGESSETLHELEARLRSEIEIQVRQEFLNQITELAGSSAISGAPSLIPPPAATPRTSNYLDQAREATGLAPAGEAAPESRFPAGPHTAATSPAPTLSASVISVPQASAPPPVSAGIPSPAPASTAFSSDFVEEAAEIFRVEAEEHLQTISMYVAALEKDPTNRELIQGVRRATHTLKGAAGMMGFRAIADLSHVSEDLLDSIMEGTTSISPAVLSLILDTAETLDMLINNLGAEPQEAKVQELRTRYAAILGEHSTTQDTLEEEIDSDLEANDEAMHDAASVAGVVADRPVQETNAQRAARGDLSVRVRLQKLDELVNLFGELLVNRTVLEERIERLMRLVTDVGMSSNRLRDIGQKLESRFEAATLPSGRSVSVMPGEGRSSSRNGHDNGRIEPSHIAEFDELELDRYTEFHQLARGLSECVSDMTTLSTEMEAVIRECEGVFSRENRLSTTFQDRLMKARLVPLSSMTPRLYRAARAVALKQHKEFEFLLEGEETEVDRTVYEEIAGPLLHLMRNAVNHAIETPEERVAKGKSPVGHITLSAAYEGNQVVITVKDDGTGIDPNKVRNEAIARGIIRPDQVLSDGDVLELIFRPGFSTAGAVSEESGRGVGLDVVRDSVARLRGTLAVDSAPGQGTAFTMKFPTSLAIQSAMMVMVSGQQFAIPTVIVDAIGRLDSYKQTVFGGRPAVVVQNDIYPLSLLAQYLNLPVEKPDEKAPLLLINTGEQRVALLVNEIKGKMDVVMKNLGPHLREVHGVAGGTVLGNGRVVLILELAELLSTRRSVSALPRVPMSVPAQSESVLAASTAEKQVESAPIRRGGILAAPPAAPTQAARGKHILVVDDSPSVRRVVSNMLKQHGWETQMARDGVEALELISQQTPAAVLLDIEMPRMDGYELMATIRAQEQYRTLPLVVLTSRAAAKHQQRAMQIGANGYVVKPYQDEELITMLNTLVYGTTV
jgi:chemotaxis protein histidine kinase CheA/ActR/RegA family two-component response regulator